MSPKEGMYMKRSTAAQVGNDTLRILEAGYYTSPEGLRVAVADLVQRAVAGTCSYPPSVSLPRVSPGTCATRFEVENESTLAAARRLAAAGHRPAALNFASAKNPGGGFLGGARAQEESLARASGLYACIQGNPMYEFHRNQSDALYTAYAIYSPDVPVFRDDEGTLLEAPHLCAFITAPAVNANVVLQRDPRRRSDIHDAMEIRVRRVLTIAAAHGHRALVLGAWGCGVFGNDCQEVAELFHSALATEFSGVFETVVFAVLDGSPEERFIGPFRTMFAPQR